MEVEAEYACFNGRRTLKRIETSEPVWQKIESGISIKDLTQPENYYLNRKIIIVDDSSSIDISNENSSRIDIVTFPPEPEKSINLSGYKLEYNVSFCGMDLNENQPIQPLSDLDLKIELCNHSQRRQFIDEICRSIDKNIDSSIISAKENFYCTDNFKCYLAKFDNQVVGLATLFISGETGRLANAFTYLKYREQGVHSMLINKRIEDAGKLGLRYLVTEVEADSKGERNIKRLAFSAIASGAVWIKDYNSSNDLYGAFCP